MDRFFIFLVILNVVFAENYALLIVGTKGYENYRHQAEICRLSHILTEKGIKSTQLIIFSYNDVINADENPFKGELYSDPDSNKEVYNECDLDYSGENVNAVNIIDVLFGKSEHIEKFSGIAKPKVFNTTNKDNIFIAYIGEGDDENLFLPNSKLGVSELIDTFKVMNKNKLYGNIYLLIQSSGSNNIMNKLPNNMKIYSLVSTSLNPIFCSNNNDSVKIKREIMNTCLNDLFIYKFIRTYELNSEISIKETYNLINNKLFIQQFGDIKSISNNPLDMFLNANHGRVYENKYIDSFNVKKRTDLASENNGLFNEIKGVPQRDVKLFTLNRMYNNTVDEKRKESLLQQIKEEEHFRNITEVRFVELVKYVVKSHDEIIINHLLSQQKSKRSDDRRCYYDMIKKYIKECGPSKEYALHYYHVLINICNYLYGDIEEISRGIDDVCERLKLFN